jgi:hypothetical protein
VPGHQLYCMDMDTDMPGYTLDMPGRIYYGHPGMVGYVRSFSQINHFPKHVFVYVFYLF